MARSARRQSPAKRRLLEFWRGIRKRRRCARSKRATVGTGVYFESIEPRVLLSGGAEGVLVDTDFLARQDFAQAPVASEIAFLEQAQQTPLIDLSGLADPDTKIQPALIDGAGMRELIFVDENVADYEQLITDLQQSDDHRNIEMEVLESDWNGIEQVTQVLWERSNLTAVHFITHGADGQIDLGNTWLNSTTLQQNTDAISAWGHALTETGDILFYGCNIAAGSDGQSLLNTIADLTGADVAASDDLTGSAPLGGDWILEFNSGSIETAAAAAGEDVQQHWVGLLAAPTGNNDSYSVNEDTTLSVDSASGILANDTDPESDPLTARVIAAPGNGVLVLNPVGSANATNLTNNAADDTFAGWSPDGSKIAFVSDRDGDNEIYVMDADGSNVTQLTVNGVADTEPDWSPDGTKIAFLSLRDGQAEIYVMDADGSNQTRLTDNSTIDAQPNWSPDGTKIAFQSYRDGNDEIYVMDADGSNQTRVIVNGASEAHPDWSPDGTKIAFQSDRDGNNEIYVTEILSDGAFTYTPEAGFAGVDTFTYVANDGTSDSNVATVTITVNDPPTAADNTVTTNEDTTCTFTAADFNFGDINGDSLAQVQITSLETAGSLQLNGADVTLSQVISRADIDAGNLTFTPAANANGAGYDSFGFKVHDGTEYSASGYTMTVDVTAVNDAPTANIGPSAFGVNEDDGPRPLGGFSVGDIDVGSGDLAVTLSVNNGKITLGSTTGLTFTDGANGTASMTFIATVTNANSALASIRYAGNPNFYGTDTITLSANDQGNTGSGGPLTRSDTANITVSPVNDAPVVGAPGAALNATEKIALAIHGTGFTVSDVDEAGAGTQAILSVGEGTITVVEGDSGVTIASGNGTGSVTLTGTVAQIDNLLTGTGTGTITYLNDLDVPSASTTFTVTVNDRGHTGSDPGISGDGSSEEGTNNVTINIAGVNDAPTATNLSAPETYTEDTPLGLTDIAVSDVDSANVTVTLTLSDTAAGSLSTGTSGAVTSTYNAGTGVWSASGAIADVNTLLAGVTFNPATNYNSNFTIATSVDDGTAAPVTGTKNMTGTAVNDAPVNSVPGAQTTAVDTPLVFSSGNGNLISVFDLDVGGNAIQATLEALNGTLTLSGIGGLTFSVGDGTDDTSMIFTGTIADINTTLDGLTYTPTSGYAGLAAVRIIVSDLGYTGSGGAKSDSDQVDITVSEVNDPPTLTTFAAAIDTTAEDTEVEITLAELKAQGDEADSDGMVVAFVVKTVTTGTLRIGATAGTATAWAAGTNDTIDATNNAYWTPANNANGTLNAFTAVAKDNDGAESTTPVQAQVTVTPVNDAPTATNLSAPETYTEDTPLNLTDIVVSDVDSANVTATLTLSDPAAGSLSTGASGAVTSAYDAGTGVWTASGAIADVNTLLAGVVFNPSTNYNSNLTIATSVSDGVAASLTGVKNMTATPVNDAPIITSASITLSEGQTVTLAPANFSITDPDDGSFTYTVSAISGGYFQLSSAPGTPITTFTSADLSGSLVQFVDDGNEVAPAFSVTVNDGDADSNTLAATISYTPVNDAPVGVPTITGTVTEDQTLTTDTSGISDADGLGAFSYQWLRNGVAIGGATASTYTLGDADVGTQISVQVSYTDSHGTNESLTSAQTAPVANMNEPPTGSVTISGSPTEDQTLTASNTLADADGMGVVSYQWQRDGVDIVGAAGSTYTLGDADVDTTIAVVASYTDGSGTNESVTSSGVGPVANVNDPAVGVPTITGTVTEDQTLTAGTAGISDSDGLGTFSYQWLRNGVAITGATNSTYTLGDADVDTHISVRVSYTDGHGTAESLTSAQTAEVANITVPNVYDTPVDTPTIPSFPTEDQVFTVDDSGISDAHDPGVFSHQPWLGNDANIGGSGSTSTLGDTADSGNPTDLVEPQTVTQEEIPKEDVLEEFNLALYRPPERRNGMSNPPIRTDVRSILLRKESFLKIGTARDERSTAVQGQDLRPEGALSEMRTREYEYLRDSLDAVKQEMTGEIKLGKMYLGSAIVSSIGLSVGYVVWLLRGGMLLASLLSSMPAWRILDVLPILARKKKDDQSDDDESLESIVDKKPRQTNLIKKTPDASSDAKVKRQ